MIRETRYLLLIVLALCLGIAGYDLLREPAAAAPSSAPDLVFEDAAGTGHHLPPHWSGSSKVAPLLGLNFSTELIFTLTEANSLVVSFAVGADRGENVAAKVTAAGGATQATWSGRGNDYEYVRRDNDASGKLYVTRNRARYLVLLESAVTETTPARRVVQTLSAVVQEGWALVRPRAVGLVISYVFVAGLFYLAYWVLLRKRLAHRKIQDAAPKKGAVAFELRHSFLALVATALFSYGLVFLVERGQTKLYRDVAEYGWGYWFFSLMLLLVLVDFYVYWTHRLMHHRSLFKYFHKVHHHSNRPTPWATFSVNVNEIIVNAMFMPLVVLVIPVHQNTTLVFALISIVKNVINHLGYEIFPGWSNRGALRWLVSPSFHEAHHVKFNCNYGAYFTWWDRWMGTEHLEFESTFKKPASNTLPELT